MVAHFGTKYHIGNTMKNIGPGCASTGTRMLEYRYPGCGSTGPDGSNIFSGTAPIGGILVTEKN